MILAVFRASCNVGAFANIEESGVLRVRLGGVRHSEAKVGFSASKTA
jgi:hypothetical protein